MIGFFTLSNKDSSSLCYNIMDIGDNKIYFIISELASLIAYDIMDELYLQTYMWDQEKKQSSLADKDLSINDLRKKYPHFNDFLVKYHSEKLL